MSDILTSQGLIALATLTGLEIVLGIDNIVFIALVAGKLEPKLRDKARYTGISLAVITRILLLLTISWVASLTAPLFSIATHDVSGRDLILLCGGMFLIGKATFEIHHRVEGDDQSKEKKVKKVSFTSIIIQILIIDIIFSLDSVITAVGMTNNVAIMIASIIIALIVMLAFSGVVLNFVEKYPTIKMLALSFLLLIGVMLVADGFGRHIEKGYIYFAMGFSLFVEMLNIRITNRRKAKN